MLVATEHWRGYLAGYPYPTENNQQAYVTLYRLLEDVRHRQALANKRAAVLCAAVLIHDYADNLQKLADAATYMALAGDAVETLVSRSVNTLARLVMRGHAADTVDLAGLLADLADERSFSEVIDAGEVVHLAGGQPVIRGEGGAV